MNRFPAEPAATMLWFDLDDTLWDMSGNSAICLREIYDSAHLDCLFATPEEWDRVYHGINLTLWEQYGNGEITRDYLRSERFARPLRLAGMAEDEAAGLSAQLDPLYLGLLGRKTSLIVGARETLDYLSARGYRMGIVSNGFHEGQYNKMRSSEIDGYFDIVVLSDDAGYNKPDPRFFDYALEKAGSRGKRNIVIGDNPTADIEGALNAGLEAVMYRRRHDTGVYPGVTNIDRLTDLKTIF